jgi:nucleotide-binding universal stress UspA family protein
MNENTTTTKGPVLALVEGGDRDRLVIDRGNEIAQWTNAPLTLLRVAPLVENSRPRSPLSAGWMQPWLIMRDQERVLRAATAAEGPIRASVEVRFGDPLDELRAEADVARPSSIVAVRTGGARDLGLAAAFGARLELVGRPPDQFWVRTLNALLDQLAGGSDRRKLEVLRSVSLFSHLGRRQLEFIAQHLDSAKVEAGTVLIREGEHNGAFWILRKGEVEVTLRGRRRRRIGAHGFFGAISMLDGREASSTVIARTPISAYVASSAQFRALEGNELVSLRLKADAEERLREDMLELTRELATAR